MAQTDLLGLEPLRERLREHPRWRWMALLVVATGMMVSVVNVSIVNVALPLMADDLDVDAAAIGWVVTGYLITQATLLPIAGRAGDLYGRRRVFIFGLVVLLVGSVLCAVAPNALSLVAFRVMQGVGAAVMPPIAFASVGELFSPRERGRAMGTLVSVISIGPVVALAISGVLVSLAGWRSLFWFTPVFVLIALVGALLVLPRSTTRAEGRFDVIGALLAAGGLFPALLALSRGAIWGWTSSSTLGLLVIAAVLLAVFVWHESRTDDPMIALDLFRLRSLRTANMASMTGAATLFGVLLVLPFYMSAVLGYGPIGLAFGIMPVAIVYTVVSPFAGRGINRFGADRVAMMGYALAAAGTLGLAAGAASQTYLAILPGILALSAGLAFATSPITVVAISEVPLERLGVASSFPNISRYAGGAFGAAILGSVLTASVPVDDLTDVSPEIADRVVDGFTNATLIAVVFLALAFVAAWRMPGSPGTTPTNRAT